MAPWLPHKPPGKGDTLRGGHLGCHSMIIVPEIPKDPSTVPIAKQRVPVLGQVVDVWVQPESDSADLPSPAQLRALDAFLALDPKQKNDWTHQVALDCHYTCLRFEVNGDDPPLRLRKRDEVWKHVRLRQVFIPQHGTTRDRYVFVHGGCDWEEEHGLELLFKNQRLFRVGQQGGLAQNEEWSLYFINE